MLTFQINNTSNIPIYRQIYSYIRTEIESGNIKSGEKLPSKRVLASHMNVSVVTVETAYSQLLSEGYIRSKAGSGFYVEDYNISAEIEKIPDISINCGDVKYDFGTSSADTSLFPFSVWARLSRATLNEKTTDLLNSCDFRGIYSLREEISQYLHKFRGMEVSPDQIIVGAGSEYLLGLIIQLLGRDMAYGVENPGYRRIYDIFSISASRVFPVPMDEKGASVSVILGFGINVIHVTPSHHFPLGITMPIVRRQELLQWAYAKSERYIIEDDCDCEFCYNGRPAPALQSLDKQERVIYLNTFTRTLAPSIRIGYMVLPEHLAEKFRSRLGFYSCTVPVFEQYTLAKFMAEGHFERHINRIKKVYRQRRDTLINCIKNTPLSDHAVISGEGAGLHIVLKVVNGMSQNQLVSSALKAGIKIHGLTEYYSFPDSNIPENSLVMGFSGIDTEQIEKAFNLLF
ncbi:MAG TPA: PLP-dependent aminotransferase family protein [Ruminococcus sp.]